MTDIQKYVGALSAARIDAEDLGRKAREALGKLDQVICTVAQYMGKESQVVSSLTDFRARLGRAPQHLNEMLEYTRDLVGMLAREDGTVREREILDQEGRCRAEQDRAARALTQYRSIDHFLQEAGKKYPDLAAACSAYRTQVGEYVTELKRGLEEMWKIRKETKDAIVIRPESNGKLPSSKRALVKAAIATATVVLGIGLIHRYRQKKERPDGDQVQPPTTGQ